MDIPSLITWSLIFFCISQSAMFSGMNLAVFGISRMRLEVAATNGNTNAMRVLDLRRDSNFTLTTILWGNVASNTLLAILSNSVMTGVTAFFFSTVFITFIGEIAPQAYCSRNALLVTSRLAPLLLFYRRLLYPLARPSAKLLDYWLGDEGIQYFRERDFREVIKQHIRASDQEITRLEGLGAINFLEIDDLTVLQEGEVVHPDSIIRLPLVNGLLRFPEFENRVDDSFLQQVQRSRKKWIILTNEDEQPQLVMDADMFLRSALFSNEKIDPLLFCHRPLIADNPKTVLGELIPKLQLHSGQDKSSVDRDIILVWTGHRRVITGTDILDRLLQGTGAAY